MVVAPFVARLAGHAVESSHLIHRIDLTAAIDLPVDSVLMKAAVVLALVLYLFPPEPISVCDFEFDLGRNLGQAPAPLENALDRTFESLPSL